MSVCHTQLCTSEGFYVLECFFENLCRLLLRNFKWHSDILPSDYHFPGAIYFLQFLQNMSHVTHDRCFFWLTFDMETIIYWSLHIFSSSILSYSVIVCHLSNLLSFSNFSSFVEKSQDHLLESFYWFIRANNITFYDSCLTLYFVCTSAQPWSELYLKVTCLDFYGIN